MILRLERRRLIWTNVTAHPTAEWLAQQITETFPWDQAPRYLIRDRDRLWRRGHTSHASHGHSRPAHHATFAVAERYVERLIGSARRDCLDHVMVLGESHLRLLLANYTSYYSGARTLLALDKDAPLHRPVHTVGPITSVAWLGGLHRQYVRMA